MRGSSEVAAHPGKRRGARAVRVAESNGEGKDAFLLADGNASSSETRERRKRLRWAPAHKKFLAFLVLIFSSRILFRSGHYRRISEIPSARAVNLEQSSGIQHKPELSLTRSAM